MCVRRLLSTGVFLLLCQIITCFVGVNSLLKQIHRTNRPCAPGKYPTIITTPTSSSSLALAGPGSDWVEEESVDNGNDVSIDASIIDKLENSVELLASTASINTVSYYMLEFRDEINQRWMMSFEKYDQKGFLNGKFANYIEQMIKTNKLELNVITKPPKAILRGRNSPQGSNVFVQYTHKLEPRKISHQILTVREDVSEEMIRDLGCILLENKEAIRFANDKFNKGPEAAESSRRMTRMAGQDGSTPLRDRTYHDFSLLITNLALDGAKAALSNSGDQLTIDYLDNFVEEITTLMMFNASKNMHPLDVLIQELNGPRTLIEELYFAGLTEGVRQVEVKGTTRNINVLKLAENILKIRARLAQEAIAVLKADILYFRQYYRLINDLGGFAKLDLSPSPKFSILDLDAEKVKNMEEQLNEDGILLQSIEEKSASLNVDSESERTENIISETNSSSFESSKVNDNETLGEMGFEGPTLM